MDLVRADERDMQYTELVDQICLGYFNLLKMNF